MRTFTRGERPGLPRVSCGLARHPLSSDYEWWWRVEVCGPTGRAASAQCWSRGAASPRGGRRGCGERVRAPLVPTPSRRPSLGGTCAQAWSTRGVSGCGAAQRSPVRSMGDPGRQDPNWATRWCPAPRPPPEPFPTPNPSTTRSSPPAPHLCELADGGMGSRGKYRWI